MTGTRHTEVWNYLGEQDPDWAVEAVAEKRYGGWIDDLETFYGAGEKRVAEALEMLHDLKFGRALDWGSGTGRLSFALATRFDSVTCIDVSPTMLETLRARAAGRGVDNLAPTLLSQFAPAGNHDLALSLITLQHLPDRAAVAEALRAMVSALRPGGQLLVEIPLRPHTLRHRIQVRWRAYRVLRALRISPTLLNRRGLSGISMLWASKEWVTSKIEGAGANVAEVHERTGSTHQQCYYIATRRR
jgi:2-polyprenyl-3-methyl-5-hydroxy-6-metoxy-1,4-benzoquinol methylase